MQISRPGFDAIPPGSFRDLVDALHDLYRNAGCPASRVVSASIYGNRSLEVVSHETYRAALRGSYLLSWPKYRSIIVDLNQRARPSRDENEILAEFQELWARAQAESHRQPRSREIPVPFPRSGRGEPPQASGSAVTWPILNLPDRNRSFTGRRMTLGKMRSRFVSHSPTIVVLHGVSGAGKTQLAGEYAHRYGESYPIVWWIRCGTIDEARASLAELGVMLGLNVGAYGERSVAALSDYLSAENMQHLLIFDGVENRAIRDLVPNADGHVIITTTDRELAFDNTMFEVEVLDFGPDEAREFLSRRLPKVTDAQALEMIELVGRLPLALDLAALCDPATLHSEFGPSDPVVNALRAARESLTPEQRAVCDLFGWFGPAPVPFALLQHSGGRLPEPMGNMLRSSFELRRALLALANFGLIRLSEHHVEMTSLARQALREILPEEAGATARHHVHEILAHAELGTPGRTPAKAYRDIGSHIMPAELVESANHLAQQLIVDQIRFRRISADLVGAAELGRAAVSTWQRPGFLGPDHDLVLQAQVHLASALRGLGEYTEARTMATALVRRLRAHSDYGPDNELTLTAVAGSAMDLIISGKYFRAVSTTRENLERATTALGTAHPRTLECRRQLAFSLSHAGSYREAADLDQSDFDRLRQSGDVAKTVRVAFALAENLAAIGSYSHALDLLAEHHPTGERLLGPDDLQVLAASRTAAVARRRTGQREALSDLASLYERSQTLLGRHHPQRLAITVSFANALRDTGSTAMAEELMSAAIDGYRTRLADRHPLTIAARINLAAIQRAQGRWAAARELGERAAEQLRKALGAAHPYTICAAINYATDLALAGDRSAAVLASKSIYTTARRTRGPLHLDTLAAGTNLALDLHSVGRPDEQLREQMLAAWRDLLGEHPLVAALARGCRVECDIDGIAI